MPEPLPPDPGAFFALLTGYQRTAAMKAAIELDLFTAVGEGASTASALAKRCKASERGVRILADYVTVLGLLTKTGDRYALGPMSEAFLDRRSPSYIASAIEFICDPALVQGFMGAANAVRKGGTVMSQEGTTSAENPIWIEFARAMGPLQTMPAQLVANLIDADSGARWKVLDIAAGHGQFGIAIALRNPNAEIVALDWANVLTVAEENARSAGVIERFRTIPGSAFEVDYGTDYDLVLLPNLLHHFDPEGCHEIIRRVHRALKPGGRAVTVEFVPNDDRVSPPDSATFSLVMLVSTPAGDAYTFSELEAMFRRGGFAKSELFELQPTPHRVVISHR